MVALTNPEIMKIINQYIGVYNGYLGDFSYRTHAEFYPDYCELDIDPSQYEGTTREKFIAILRSSPPQVQAKIVRGVLQRFPSDEQSELYKELLVIAKRLEGTSPVLSPDPKINSAVVERAIGDVENIVYDKDDSMTKLFKLLRQHHPALCDLGARSQDIERILQSSANIMDALNPIRNKASVAHPNEDLLNKEEAMLVINVTRSLLHYLDAKFGVATAA